MAKVTKRASQKDHTLLQTSMHKEWNNCCILPKGIPNVLAKFNATSCNEMNSLLSAYFMEYFAHESDAKHHYLIILILGSYCSIKPHGSGYELAITW